MRPSKTYQSVVVHHAGLKTYLIYYTPRAPFLRQLLMRLNLNYLFMEYAPLPTQLEALSQPATQT